jgi:hypothetical protein
MPYIVLDGMLRTGDLGAGALCIIDSSMVLFGRECVPGGLPFRETLLLAQNWSDLRVFERADQLYQQLYAISEREKDGLSVRQQILDPWISLQIARGDLERARDLAKHQTELARKAFACDERWNPTLERALKSEARILEDLSDAGAAEIARKEAASLPPLPPPEDCGEPVCVSISPPLRECNE